VHELDLAQRLEKLAREVRRASRTGGSESELAGLRFREREKVLYRSRRQRWMNDQHFRHATDQRDRREVLHRIVGQFFMETHVDGVRRRVAH
jgi:hypothetical protein